MSSLIHIFVNGLCTTRMIISKDNRIMTVELPIHLQAFHICNKRSKGLLGFCSRNIGLLNCLQHLRYCSTGIGSRGMFSNLHYIARLELQIIIQWMVDICIRIYPTITHKIHKFCFWHLRTGFKEARCVFRRLIMIQHSTYGCGSCDCDSCDYDS